MSPEQLTGQPVARHWDIWALTVMTYEMLSGASPFGTPASVAALHSAILTRQLTPLGVHLPDAPATWQQFFARTLTVEAAGRPGSAIEFLSECERMLGTSSPP